MGLAVLSHISEIKKKKIEQAMFYFDLLSGLKVGFPDLSNIDSYNYAYFPILFKNEELLLKSMIILEDQGIGSRRYFYPGLNTMDYTKGDCPISDSISSRILCLPLYHTLAKEEQRMVGRLLLRSQNN